MFSLKEGLYVLLLLVVSLLTYISYTFDYFPISRNKILTLESVGFYLIQVINHCELLITLAFFWYIHGWFFCKNEPTEVFVEIFAASNIDGFIHGFKPLFCARENFCAVWSYQLKVNLKRNVVMPFKNNQLTTLPFGHQLDLVQSKN